MTAEVTERPAPPSPGKVASASRPRARRIDSVTVLSFYTLLLMGIPAALVVAPLGAVGGPATIFAALVLIFYLVTWLHPALAPERGRQPIRAAAILFTSAVIATYVSANRHAMSGLESNGADRGIILVCGWLGILLMASDGIASMERLKKLIGRVVIGATAMAVLGITQFFTGLNATQYVVIPGLSAQSLATDLLSRNGLNRPSATAAHPLEFAAVLAIALPFAVNRARFAPPGLRLRRWLQVALIGAALPMSVSRTAILAVIVICLVLLPTWPKIERRVAYGVLAVSVMGLWVLVPGLLGTFRTLFAQLSSDSSTTSRTSAFSSAGAYVSQHPWFGRGFGTFFPAAYFFTDDQYLLSTIEIGIVGVLALLALFIMGLVTAQKIRRATANVEIRDLGQCMTASVAVSMVAFGTFDALSFGMAAGLTFMLLGCAGAARRLLRAQGAQPDSRWEQPAYGRLGQPTAGPLGLLPEKTLEQPTNGHQEQPAAPAHQEQPAADAHRKEPAADAHRKEPAADADQEQPAAATHQEKPAAAHREQPAAPTPQEQPTAATRREWPPAPTRQEQPAAAAHQEETAATHREQPPAPTRQEQPTAATHWEQLAAAAHRKEPAAAVDREQPAAAANQEQVAAAAHKEQPTAAMQPAAAEQEEPAVTHREQPAAAMHREQPAVTAKRDQPAAVAEREQPATAQQEEPAAATQPDQVAAAVPKEQVAAAAEQEEPAPATQEEPAATHREQPAAAVYREQPAGARPEEPAAAARQEPLAAKQQEEPAAAPDKEQPAAAAQQEEPAAVDKEEQPAGRQAEQPAERREEPTEARPEEQTIPIPVVRP
jgi:O-antigen ligase